jgi:hypothetical protein
MVSFLADERRTLNWIYAVAFPMSIADLILTRRMCGRMLAGVVLAGLRRSADAADLAGGSRLTWESEPGPATGHERRYRATAQILVFSLPLVRWPNVGGGSAAWRESSSPNDGELRLLEFTGFSRPERAAGLNRLGFIRELSRVSAGNTAESIYFGLMTASPEETAEEARKSLHSKAKEAAYTAIDGRLTAGSVETVVAHFMAPANWSADNRNELIQLARKALAVTPPRPPEREAHGAEVRSFLETLANALRQTGPVEARFAYAGRFYKLWLEKAPDAKATTNFRERGLVSANTQVLRASGKLRREAGGKESNFRLWVEEGAARPLPLRIEYQARAFLRLIFEAEG